MVFLLDRCLGKWKELDSVLTVYSLEFLPSHLRTSVQTPPWPIYYHCSFYLLVVAVLKTLGPTTSLFQLFLQYFIFIIEEKAYDNATLHCTLKIISSVSQELNPLSNFFKFRSSRIRWHGRATLSCHLKTRLCNTLLSL